MLLVFECFKDVFEADVGRRGRLGALGFASQRLDLFQIIVKLMVCFIDICMLARRVSSKFLL